MRPETALYRSSLSRHCRHAVRQLQSPTSAGRSSLQSPRTRVYSGNAQHDNQTQTSDEQDAHRRSSNGTATSSGQQNASISTLKTEEWEKKYSYDGCVDLWVEEEFNAGSRLTGGRAAHFGKRAGIGSGEGPSQGQVARHKIKIFNHHTSQELDVEVPEDRYILAEAEEQGLILPWACRMGCCTTCAVKVLEGEVFQPQSLGVSKELKEAGYALLCVSYPKGNAVVQTLEEDEVYDKQFGNAFAERALKPGDKGSIERDDFALEIANMDE